MPLLFLCLPLDSAERASVQPAAEPRHVQRHEHEPDVLRAPRACPASHLHSWGPPSTLLAPLPPHARPPPGPHAAPFPMLPFRLGSTCMRSTSR
eukprot:scaffold125028_cov42-Phaeocystis_antarctica.AAC.1